MNFFQAQDDARRRTKWLVVYFILAVIGVIISVYGVVAIAMTYLGTGSPFMPSVFLVTAVITGGVMGTGSLFKSMQLNGGGSVVARDMGARQVDAHTTDTDERRLVNVVEEMAIASGVPVPEIWIMDEELGINAFAAGTEPGNAVVAVTRGCLQRLTRDELQGVVAHEFSHILNGDMRLNMRLMGLLFGILMISMIGRTLFHALRFMNVRSSSRDNKGGGGVVIAILLAGVGLMIVGSIGVFFGRLIQAAISRQREYLADASAVQFTRDTNGIAGALMKIGGQEYGSKINAAKAAEASHLFFADGGMFSYGLATHPPLDRRIKALEKSWDGKFISTQLPDVALGRAAQRDARLSGFSGDTSTPPPLPGQTRVARSEMNQLGEPSRIDAAVGRHLHAGLDAEWIHACHDREEAQALIFGLLLAEDNQLREEEVLFVQKGAGHDAGELSVEWNHKLTDLHSSVKIALVDLAIPTLRRLSLPEYERFVEITQWLIASDGQVDLFEFMLQHIVQRHLDSHFRRTGHDKIRYRRIEQLETESNVLLTTMAALGGEDQMESAYRSALEESGATMTMLPPSECGLKNVEQALEKFDAATPLVKKQLLRMLGMAVMHDGSIESREAELLRATADAIGCSVPPFVKNS
ncbi:Zn-dependent protease [Oceaniferula spumae]|uniref:Zn-dependent protease n=1 Tax=Oceaniferula spumae TaxID=2979115 RepID=A0AAT9FHY9_9BACT